MKEIGTLEIGSKIRFADPLQQYTGTISKINSSGIYVNWDQHWATNSGPFYQANLIPVIDPNDILKEVL